MDSQFDVFISYNWNDKVAVVQIAEKLRAGGLAVWLDDWEIQPGSDIPKGIDRGINNCRSVAIFVGPDDVGPFQDAEIQAIVMKHVGTDIPTFPVLLPGAGKDAIKKLPLLLQSKRWVDFNGGAGEEEYLYLLQWGITGKRPPRAQPSTEGPRDPEAQRDLSPVRQRDPVEDALKQLAEQLKRQNVTYFLGPGAAVGCQPMPTPGCDIARELLCEVDIIKSDYPRSGLLPHVSVAGMYYSVKSGDRILEEKVMQQPPPLGSTQFPPAHDELARLLSLLPTLPTPRGGSRVPQLIITTNLDLMMERALLRAGLSFTRIVQYRSGEQIDVDVYRHVQLNGDGTVQLPPAAAGGAPRVARVDDVKELDAVIKTRRTEDRELSRRPPDGIPWTEMPEPILYKFLGSQEVPNSCVLSASHHFKFPRRVLQRNSIPTHVNDIITNSTTLFLGPWFTDPDFLLTYYTLLCDSFGLSSDIRYAVQLHPQRFEADIYRRQMDSPVWEEIKENVMMEMKIKTIEADVADFLRRLCGRV
ncbi:MAG TPA: TIR domain-containing protein [Pyrinomonadaceae bacterium]|nr:TIR domain-containing protein [Pyrinomonadaceae bacterium]